MDPKWIPNGSQMDPKWTPNGPQMDRKLSRMLFNNETFVDIFKHCDLHFFPSISKHRKVEKEILVLLINLIRYKRAWFELYQQVGNGWRLDW